MLKIKLNMNLLTMIFPLLCYASISLLVANANPTFEGYRYEKPSIAFEYPTFTKMLPKNTDIKPTPTKVTKEKIATKSQLNSATAIKPTMTTATVYQQHQEKTHKIEKIEKSTVINPTAIKETNLNIKSNKNPVTPATITKTKTTAEKTETLIKTKPDKLSLNQLPNNSSVITTTSTHSSTSSSSSAGCSLYVQQEQTNLNFKHKLENNHIKATDPAVLASQEAALENLLNRDNGYIYRVATKVSPPIKLNNNLPHTQHDYHHGTKRLKLKHDLHHADHLIKAATLKYCCEQSFDSLKEKFSQLALNRPSERRLAPYTESLKEKEYFE